MVEITDAGEVLRAGCLFSTERLPYITQCGAQYWAESIPFEYTLRMVSEAVPSRLDNRKSETPAPRAAKGARWRQKCPNNTAD